MKKRFVSLVLCMLMVISIFPAAAGAATMADVPKSIGAPANVTVFQDSDYPQFDIGYSATDELRKLSQLFDNGEMNELGLSSFGVNYQIDYKYNDSGSWHYDSSWDEFGISPYEFGANVSATGDTAYISYKDMEPADVASKLTDNTVYFRIRFIAGYYNEETGEDVRLISPWSETVSMGKDASSAKVTSVEAPTLVSAQLKKDDKGKPYFEITLKVPESVKALNNGAGSITQLTSVKKSDGSWSSESGTSADIIQEVFTVEPEDIGGLDTVNIEAANYDVRVRFGYSSVYAGDIEVYSPYSNIVTIGTPAYSNRLSGADRIQTAIAVCREGWPNGASTVILTRDDNYPDALTGAPLSKKLDAPILFTNSLVLSSATEAEIARLKVKKVIILGGTGAVSQDIENKLKLSYEVQRIGGMDRYETAAKIAKELGYKGKAVITTGEDFHDALTVSPLAAYEGIPILLTLPYELPSHTKEALQFVAPTEITVVGNSTNVNDSVFAQLSNAKRISGTDIYRSAVEVAKSFGADTGRIFLATGKDFPDALSGSGLAAKYNSPILFVNEPLSDSVKQYLEENKGKSPKINLLGGEGAISKNVQDIVEQIIK